MKNFSLALILIFFAFSHNNIYGQGAIKGLIVDSISKKPLSFATISLLRLPDTSLITYRMSDQNGEFKVPNVPANLNGYIVISYTGYDVYRKIWAFSNGYQLMLDTVKLKPNTKSLDEILIVAERPPVRVFNDTIEFNASSFSTLPTALVEDLLRKFPGVQVDSEGNITVNGKPVNRILVDGKLFFGGDPKMATRNLPANIIGRVQVIDDQQQKDRSVNGDFSQIGKVINLALKKGVNKGWFGRLYGGVGTNERYEGGGIANIYRDTLQLSLLGYTNNVNRAGFTLQDVSTLGGFERSGINSLNIQNRNGSQGFSINGINFGGLDEGLARSSGAGFNLNHAPSKRFTLYTQYFYGNNRNNILNGAETQQNLQDTFFLTNTNAQSIRNVFTHVLNTGTDYNPSQFFSLTFRASGNYQEDRSNGNSIISTSTNKSGLISNGAGDLNTRFHTGGISYNIHITRKSRKKEGRIINFDHRFDVHNDLRKTITETVNQYWIPSQNSIIFNQLRSQNTPYRTATAQINVAEPLSKWWIFRFSNNYDYLFDKQDVGLFSKDTLTDEYNIRSNLSSGLLQREQHRNNSNFSLSYMAGSLNINGGFSLFLQHTTNIFTQQSQRNQFNLTSVLPNFFISWKNLSAGYSESVTIPELQVLNPIPDSTNPFYIFYGNPNLNTSRDRSANINFFRYDSKRNIITSFFLRGTSKSGDVILARNVSVNGVQSIYPINANGTIQFSAGTTIGKEIKQNNSAFSFGITPYINFNKSKIIVNDKTAFATTSEWGPSIYIRWNYKDIVEFNTKYNIVTSNTSYSNALFNDIKVVTHNTQATLLMHITKKITAQTNLLYRYNSQTSSGLFHNSILWNAAIAMPVTRSERGQLKLSVYDILNSNNSFSRYTKGNTIVDTYVNVLTRYGLLSFIYNLQTVGSNRRPKERKSLFLF